MLNHINRTTQFLIALAVLGMNAAALASPTLSLTLSAGSGSVPPGGLVQVTVRMSGLGAQSAAGFQAFLHFETTRLQFVNGSYTSSPFGLAVITTISATPGGDIDLASGINQFGGQTPSSADAPLAYLTFTSINGACDETAVQFRSHVPPTRLSTNTGGDILPLTLIGLQPQPTTCLGDIDHNNVVNIDDLVLVITHWGRCPPLPPCCTGDIFPDPGGDHVVNIDDLVLVITSWGACP